MTRVSRSRHFEVKESWLASFPLSFCDEAIHTVRMALWIASLSESRLRRFALARHDAVVGPFIPEKSWRGRKQ
jgi:hypothetical protein